jgi:SAM-dependent methyltransferase
MEIGPGDCALALAVANYVKTVYAVDVTDALFGEVAAPKKFYFAQSNGVTVPVPAGTVDLAYSNQVLEHLHPDDVYDHLLSIHASLVPGGRLMCVTPNRLSGPWDISRHFDEAPTGLHLKEYTVSELADLLRAVGFGVTLFASYRGRGSFPVAERAVRVYEQWVERLPRRVRRPLALSLTGVKVLAKKP